MSELYESPTFHCVQYKIVGRDPTDAVTGVLQVLKTYPSLSLAAKQAVLNFAANIVSIEEPVFLHSSEESKSV